MGGGQWSWVAEFEELQDSDLSEAVAFLDEFDNFIVVLLMYFIIVAKVLIYSLRVRDHQHV